MDDATRARIVQEIDDHPIVLFMKGTPAAPRCGFSATVAGILDELVGEYRTVDVLSDSSIREGIKAFSDWPTIPQLYVKGEFVGGCDLVREMYESGELEEALGLQVPELSPPSLHVTPKAAEALRAALADAADDDQASEAQFLRIGVSSEFVHELSITERQPRDVEATAAGLLFLLDRASVRRAEGLRIDSVQGESGPAFRLENPNEPPKVKPISVAALHEKLTSGEAIELFDVRSQKERDTAHIEGSRLLDRDAQQYIMTLNKTTPLYFHCHHGQRSQQAAAFFLQHGFENVFNVEGGIDAWSRQVDPNVPTY